MNKQLFTAMLGVAALILAAGLAPGTATAARLAFESPTPPPPPANDNLADAEAVGVLPFYDTTNIEGATTEPGEPHYCNYSSRTVWYSFTPATDGLFRVDTNGSSFDDTNLSLYQAGGEGWGGLNYLDCRSFVWWEPLVFIGRAGTTYYIQAGKIYDGDGDLQVNLQEIVGPPNDFFSRATPITQLPFSDRLTINEATTEPGEPQPCYSSQRTLWYKFTPSADGVISASTEGSAFDDGNLAIYQAVGPGLEGLDFIGCALFNGSVLFSVQAGETYYIQAGSSWGTGDLQVNVDAVAPPPNDNLADATQIIGLPFGDTLDTSGASLETGEPTPTCIEPYDLLNATGWYVFTPDQSLSISSLFSAAFGGAVVAAYTRDSPDSWTEVGCRRPWQGRLSFRAEAGTQYFFQVGSLNSERGQIQFNLEVAPPPEANFGFDPWDPSVFDHVQFWDYSWDPAEMGIQAQAWDFGDGTTSEGCCPNHQYAQDGDYAVQLTVTTEDGRSASTTRTVPVKTHDVAIIRLSASQAAKAGQTRQIAVELNSKRYPETVEVQLFKSVPGGFAWVGSLVQSVPVRPANRTTRFSFSYTFTAEDARIGKVTFKAVANIQEARDALPADNEAIASPTKVSR